MTKLPLTKQKQKWLGKRKVTLRGSQLNYNAAQQRKYKMALESLVNKMTEEVKKQVIRLFNGEIADDYFIQQEEVAAMDANITSKARILMNKLTSKFQQLFSKNALDLAEVMINGAANVSKTSLHSSLKQLSGGLSLKTGVIPKGLQEVSKSLIAENVSLIKSIPQQYFKDITGSVMRSITTGRGLADLVPAIEKYKGQTKRRAKNLALDQTRKAYNSINKARMIAVKVKQFEWSHSGGGQAPRESHIKISGHIFDFVNLEKQQAALGVPKQDRGIPGYPINCRCTMVPVIDFSDDE